MTPPPTHAVPPDLAEKIRELNLVVLRLEGRITTVESLAKQLRQDWSTAKDALRFLMEQVVEDLRAPVIPR